MAAPKNSDHLGALIGWFDRLCAWHEPRKWYCRTLWFLALVPPFAALWYVLGGSDTPFRHVFWWPWGGV
jgi:hypothetical protein